MAKEVDNSFASVKADSFAPAMSRISQDGYENNNLFSGKQLTSNTADSYLPNCVFSKGTSDGSREQPKVLPNDGKATDDSQGEGKAKTTVEVDGVEAEIEVDVQEADVEDDVQDIPDDGDPCDGSYEQQEDLVTEPQLDMSDFQQQYEQLVNGADSGTCPNGEGLSFTVELGVSLLRAGGQANHDRGGEQRGISVTVWAKRAAAGAAVTALLGKGAHDGGKASSAADSAAHGADDEIIGCIPNESGARPESDAPVNKDPGKSTDNPNKKGDLNRDGGDGQKAGPRHPGKPGAADAGEGVCTVPKDSDNKNWM